MSSTITLLTETKGVKPQFGYTDELERACLRSGPQSFNVRARALNEYGLRRFQIEHSFLNDGGLTKLEQAWSEARGGTLPMNFTPPRDVDANAIEVAFEGSEIAYTSAGPNKWTARYTVEEVL